MTNGPHNGGENDPLDQKSLLSWLSDHPAIVGTMLYVYVALIGSSYQWWLLKGFGANYFDFAEVNDFLTAAFKSPFVIGQGIFTLVMLVWAAYRRPEFLFGTESRSAVAKMALVLFVIVYSLGPGLSVAIGRADISNGWGTYVRFEAARGAEVISGFRPLMLSATTDKFVFLYEREHQRTLVIPTANIAQMGICRTPPPWSPWDRDDEVDEPCDPGVLTTQDVSFRPPF